MRPNFQVSIVGPTLTSWLQASRHQCCNLGLFQYTSYDSLQCQLSVHRVCFDFI